MRSRSPSGTPGPRSATTSRAPDAVGSTRASTSLPPAWRLDDSHVGLFQADAGLADPSAGNVAHRRLAAAHGASLREHAPVARIEGGDGETTVVLEDGETISAGKVVVAADAWTNDLLDPLGAHLPLTVTQEQVRRSARLMDSTGSSS